MDWLKRLTGKSEPGRENKPPTVAPSPTPSYHPYPDLPNDDTIPADGVRVGESPVPGLTLRRILRGHTGKVNRIAWSPDGRLLASPSEDETMCIWDVERGECRAVLEGHKGEPFSVAWSPDGRRLASVSGTKTLRIWNTATWESTGYLEEHEGEPISLAWAPDGKTLAIGYYGGDSIQLRRALTWEIYRALEGHSNNVYGVAWSSDGSILASGSWDGSVILWDTANWKPHSTLGGHDASINVVAWSPDNEVLASGDETGRIRIWEVMTGRETDALEGHTDQISSLSFSIDNRLMASKARDNSVRLWSSGRWETLAVLEERSAESIFPSLAFHPHHPILATLGEGDTVIRIWALDMDVLLGETTADSIRYTTAKLVLVGDSGVGKTGLGWRLAHGAFREHASTHGQQFWVIDELGHTRGDGTECEAVLWDLAGQHIYRPIHAIFLDDVDASLVLFDPTNRQEPLKGVEFWLEQLASRKKLPPSVLVGARLDRGAAVLSQEDLAQFCQKHGISGGYLGTSAKEALGLDALLETLKRQIPWDQMTTTVTTRTFKRVKEYVLSLKEKPDRKGVLVSPVELRRQFEATDPDWDFSDAEMMTAVGHLQTHGYVSLLCSSSGQEHILLTPELLVDLASSIVLQADKHPRELGALNETELLQGGYPLAELSDLERDEQQILLDASVVRFLEHNICFRETLGRDALLIFPGLIKQKRPLQDEVEAVDDISYVVRGRVENIYPALVVLLGFTRTFTRVNQWQRQAQYEMGEGNICGFRLIEDVEGEIELVLYYSIAMPDYGRQKFQGLFEEFLYSRDVDVTRFPPVCCPNGHPQERSTVVKRIREGKRFLFCEECGQRIDLPDIDKQPTADTPEAGWLQQEESLVRLRSAYEIHLTRVKGFRRDRTAPRCYISHLPAQANWVARLTEALRDAGVHVITDRDDIADDDLILIASTPAYQRNFKGKTGPIAADVALIRSRLEHGKKSSIIHLLVPSKEKPPTSTEIRPGDFRRDSHYAVSLFDLVLTLYAIPHSHPAFSPLRKALRQQWEQMPKESLIEDADDAARDKGTTTEDETEGVIVSEQYVDFDLHIAPDGHAVVSSSLGGEATAEISLDVPNTVELALSLIEARQTNAKLLKQVGQAFYDWLFPGPIHTHFHQTEAVARRENRKMRLRLRVEAEGIASLPLEFLYRETGGYFVAMNPNTVLSRYLTLPMPPGFVRRRQGPLHMLAIIADPTDQTRLPPDEWEAIIEEALAGPLASGQMTLQTVKRATRKEIRNALLRQKPDIIQFVGHGIYQDGKGYLALVDETRNETWLVDEETFANLYLGYDDHLGLISLATCDSARSGDPQGFLGIAPRLVQRGIPAVLAMQYKVLIKTAEIFLEDFYTAVTARKPIDWATQSARNAISQELGLDNREFATPVLYMRAKDGEVF